MGLASGIGFEDPLAPLGRDARSLVGDADPDGAFDQPGGDRDRRAGRCVLYGVLDEVLDDLAEPRWIGQGEPADPAFDDHPMVAQERAEPADDLVEEGRDIDRHDVRRALVERSYQGQDRVHQPVQPLDLVDRPVVPLVPGPAADHVATLPPDEGRLLGEQVGVRPDDGQRCAQLVGHERDQLGSSLVERLERLDLGLGLELGPTLLDDPGEEVGDRAQLVDVRGAEVPGLLGLDVEDPDDRVVPGQRHRQRRGDEPALVDAPDPEEPRIVADVRDDGRAPGGRDPPRTPSPNGTRARPIW